MHVQMPPGRLQLLLQRTAEEVFEPDAVPDGPFVRFAAYGAHQRVFGWVRLQEERLTDLLNAHDELHLLEVELEALATGLTGTVDEVVIHRRDLVAVQAHGPRGDAAQRQTTRTYPLAVQSGNYLISGYLHVQPGIDPVTFAHERPPMIPLTDALIEYWVHGKREHQAIGTIIFNRDAVQRMEFVTHDDLLDGVLRPED